MISTDLNEAIDNATNVTLKAGANWWFSRESQRKKIFVISAELVTRHNITPCEALSIAEELVQEFYVRHVQPSTRVE